MDSATFLRQTYTKKANKENVQPAQEIKSFIKQAGSKAPAIPIQRKGIKDEYLTKTGKVSTVKHAERKKTVGVQALKKSVSKVSATDKKQVHIKDFKTGQSAKLAGEQPRPQTTLQPSKPAPGMYKGKIVESKIGSIWKPSIPVCNETSKTTVTRPANHKARNVTKTTAVGCGTQSAVPNISSSVKTTVNSRPPNGFFSARPAARSVPTTVRPRNATVTQSRRCKTIIAKPKVPVTDKKSSKPPVTSTISQYRGNSETAEEKREKLAQWLASKGRILKRPAMVSTAPSTKTTASNKPAASEFQPVAVSKPEQPEPAANRPKLASVTSADIAEDNKEAVQKTETRTSLIMNTTLDLLENSDVSVETHDSGSDRVDDIVINLCDALEALETPSQCNNDHPQVMDECSDKKSEIKEECKDVKNKSSDDDDERSEGSVNDDQEVEDVSEESDDCDDKENTPQTEGASVVKYSVKTTPFLQSVKKTIEDEVRSTSKRKSNIKDIKFLTPVRRSSRIHRQSSRLPTMLVDHDPCVSSLAELVKLDDDPNAYIYRKNPALLEDLPDQPRL